MVLYGTVCSLKSGTVCVSHWIPTFVQNSCSFPRNLLPRTSVQTSSKYCMLRKATPMSYPNYSVETMLEMLFSTNVSVNWTFRQFFQPVSLQWRKNRGDGTVPNIRGAVRSDLFMFPAETVHNQCMGLFNIHTHHVSHHVVSSQTAGHRVSPGSSFSSSYLQICCKNILLEIIHHVWTSERRAHA